MTAKDFIKSIPLLGPISVRINRLAWQRAVRRHDPAYRLRALLRNKRNLSVVQIGANDGITNDPIHDLLLAHPSWEALLVEPIPTLFERLKDNYPKENRFHFENAAVSDKPGTLPFFYVAKAAKEKYPDLPFWYDQIGSFDPAHIARHFGQNLNDYIVKAEVATLSLRELLERHHVSRIDLLHIDTEGHDWSILRQLDLARYRPKVIMFEHKHLSPQEKDEARMFVSARYSIEDLGYDYFCRRR